MLDAESRLNDLLARFPEEHHESILRYGIDHVLPRLRAARAATVARRTETPRIDAAGDVLDLKTDPEVFDAAAAGLKGYEIRKDDRADKFKVGDVLRLRRTQFTGEQMRAGADLVYTGQTLLVRVKHKLTGYGLEPGWCILSFDVLGDPDEEMPDDARRDRIMDAAASWQKAVRRDGVLRQTKLGPQAEAALLLTIAAELAAVRLSPVTAALTAGLVIHPATADLVGRFSRALAQKLADAEARRGRRDDWLDPAWLDECRSKLLECVAKGDPRDVANYCAFLWHHQATTAGAPAGTGESA